VIRGGTRLIFALAAAALVALMLAACGGSDSNSSDSDSTGSSASEARPPGESSQSESQGQTSPQTQGGSQQGSEGGPDGSQGDQKEAKVHTVKEVSAPLKISGGGSEQFLVKGGDNSIQEFGDEEGESELETAAKVVHDFYVDRGIGAWSDACALMSVLLREQLEQLASKSNVKGCAPFLEAFTSQLSAETWREITTVDAVSLRREDDHGFLIYVGAGGTVYAMPLKEEGGEWKVTGLAATELLGT
jgi:hypothetical protein